MPKPTQGNAETLSWSGSLSTPKVTPRATMAPRCRDGGPVTRPFPPTLVRRGRADIRISLNNRSIPNQEMPEYILGRTY